MSSCLLATSVREAMGGERCRDGNAAGQAIGEDPCLVFDQNSFSLQEFMTGRSFAAMHRYGDRIPRPVACKLQ